MMDLIKKHVMASTVSLACLGAILLLADSFGLISMVGMEPRPTNAPTAINDATLVSQVPTPNPSFEPIERETNGLVQVYVPSGSFMVGDLYGVGLPDEHPAHAVYTDAFWIDKFEVTNHAFAKCTDESCGTSNDINSHTRSGNYYLNPEYADFPVLGVTWNQAQAFCKWQGGRLPAEVEFEKAAGWDPVTSQSRLYPWGDTEPDNQIHANYLDKDRDTTKVGQFPDGCSAIDACDMSGNLWEWTNDFYSETYYQDMNTWINPIGAEEGKYKIIRGGSWANQNTTYLRVSARAYNNPNFDYSNVVGFRCAYDIDEG